MSASVNDCNCPCPDPQVVEVPGVEGAAGAPGTNGTNGKNAFTTVTADFVVPAIAGNVIILVADSSWAGIGQNVFVEGAGYFEVAALPSALSMTLTYLDYDGNTATGNTISSGSTITPAGVQPSFAGTLPNAITDNSTGTASDTIAAGTGVFTLPIPITLAQITGAGDVLTEFTLGYAFKILSVAARVVEAVTTGAKAADLNIEIGTTNLTGGVVQLDSANCATLGAAVAGSAVTANNTGAANATISIEAANVTAFDEGAVVLLVTIQNLDTANAVASLADHVNDLITALT